MRGVMSNLESLKFYFRVLVLVSVALNVGSAFLPYFESWAYGSEVNDLLTWSGYNSPFSWEVRSGIWYGMLFAYGIVCIGLIYFKPWARECFLLIVALTILSTFIYGVNVLTEATSVYFYIWNLIEGIIIAMIYFSELKNEFTVTHNKRMEADHQNSAPFDGD